MSDDILVERPESLLWGRGYWVASSGNVTDEVWKKYIEDQKPELPDDNFKVV